MDNITWERLEKTKETLGITRALSDKNDIHESSYIMDKWYKVQILCLWFYWMKHVVDD